ncbi:MAG: hypothetical protein KDJ47_13955 [Hyphomicrobiaceae bacterium]|nr:hypothetical protein [Hyphomicrobiaceae bacterium]
MATKRTASETSSSARPVELRDSDVDAVIGAGDPCPVETSTTSTDPVPYPDLGGSSGSTSTEPTGTVSGSNSDGGTMKAVTGLKSSGSSFTTSGAPNVKIQGK